MASRMYGENTISSTDMDRDGLAIVNWSREYGETGLYSNVTISAKSAADLIEFVQSVFEHGVSLGRYQGAGAIQELASSKTAEFRDKVNF